MKKLFWLIPLLALSACQPALQTQAPAIPVSAPTQVQSVERDISPTPESETETNPLVELAIQDLTTRINLDVQLITVVDVRPITWPDTSLGCPQEGQMYAQLLTDGYIIQLQLEANGIRYTYHTDTDRQVVLCEKLQLPFFPVTPGEIKDGEPWMPVN